MIYIVEDDDNIRKLVCYALHKEGFEVMGFADAAEFKKQLENKPCELVMLDIMLPGEDGLSLLSRLKGSAKTESIPVIMLSAKDSEFDKVTGLDMGADDYISKPFGMTELISRVRAVLRRFKPKSKEKKSVYEVGELYVDTERHIIKVSGNEITLSYKEYMLLLVLLEADGRVVGRDELLCRVWGEYYDESRTLDVHVRKLRVKLGSAGELIQTVKNIGYKLGDNGDDR